MSAADDLDILLDQWEEFHDLGRVLSAEDLCPDNPELRAQLREKIDLLKGITDILNAPEEEQGPPNAEAVARMDAGRYQPVKFVVGGGLGRIFLAVDSELRRSVALKKMHPWQSQNQENRQRFEQEAEITGRLDHPGIVPIYGFGLDSSGQPYYAMRYIHGETLTESVKRYHAGNPVAGTDEAKGALADAPVQSEDDRSVEFQKLVRSFLAVCQTVGYAHSQQILHRDLKPDNIMVGKFGETLVVDWGLAKSLAPAEPSDNSVDAKTTQATPLASDGEYTVTGGHTVMGIAKGSPAFMSPEQAGGLWDEVGPPSDVYSLGATLYFILTGQKPFDGRSLLVILDKVKKGDFAPPRQIRGEVPEALEAVCLKAMHLKPSSRYSGALALADDVERWLADEPVTAWVEPWTMRTRRRLRRHRTALTGLAAAALVSLAGLAAFAGYQQSVNSQLDSQNQQLDQNVKQLDQKNQELGQKNADLNDARGQIQKKADDLKAANENERLAADNARTQRDQAQVNLYQSDMNLAGYALSKYNVGRARELLAKYVPKPGEPDRRSNEWALLWRAVNHESRQLCKIDSQVLSLSFSPDGARLAVTESDMVQLWDVATDQPGVALHDDRRDMFRFSGASGQYVGLFSPIDKSQVAIGSYSEIGLWNADAAMPEAPLHVKELLFAGPFRALAYSPDGKMLAAAGENSTVSLWNVADWSVSKVLTGGSRPLSSLSFSPDGVWLAAVQNQKLIVWDVATGKRFDPEVLGDAPGAQFVSFTSRGHLAVAHDDLFDVYKFEEGSVSVFPRTVRHQTRVTAIAHAPTGDLFASADGRAVLLWATHHGTYRHVQTYLAHTGPVQSLTFSPDGRWLASGGDDGRVMLWDTQEQRKNLSFQLPHDRPPTDRAGFSDNGQQLVTLHYQSATWSAADGRQRTFDARALTEAPKNVLFNDDHLKHGYNDRIEVAPDGKWAAIKLDGMLSLRSTTSDATYELGLKEGEKGLVFSGDGRRLISLTGELPNLQVKVWSIPGGQDPIRPNPFASLAKPDLIKEFNIPEFDPETVESSFDGQHVYLCDHRRDVIAAWNLATGTRVALYKGMTEKGTRLKVSPDGRYLVVGTISGRVDCWRTDNGILAWTASPHTLKVTDLAFTSDSRTLATAGDDGNVILFDPVAGRQLTILWHPAGVQAVSFRNYPAGWGVVAYVGGAIREWSP